MCDYAINSSSYPVLHSVCCGSVQCKVTLMKGIQLLNSGLCSVSGQQQPVAPSISALQTGDTSVGALSAPVFDFMGFSLSLISFCSQIISVDRHFLPCPDVASVAIVSIFVIVECSMVDIEELLTSTHLALQMGRGQGL